MKDPIGSERVIDSEYLFQHAYKDVEELLQGITDQDVEIRRLKRDIVYLLKAEKAVDQ